jgi:4-amino-4-deoxy-L-arabinose transferase-like glycosyltransferase
MDRGTGKGSDAGGSSGLNSGRVGQIASALFVSALVVFSAWYLTPSLFRAWFYRSDEYAVVGEIIRFVHLDFRQHYFDMPQTPLMLAVAAAWGVIYGVAWIAGVAPRGAGIDEFTLHHLPRLFELARAASLFSGLLAIVLVFMLASRLTNRAGGCVAALLFAMCPIYAWTESTIRPEPPVVCLFVLSIFCLQRALARQEANTQARWIFASGLLAGVAAALRFHSITATFPVLLMILLSDRASPPDYPSRWSLYCKRILAAALVAAAVTMAGIETGVLPGTAAGRKLMAWWPKAFEAFFVLCAIAAAAIVVTWALRFSPRTAWLSERILHPRVFILGAGAALGVLAGTPTILWRPENFFESIQMYTTSYTDVERMAWPVARHLAWLFGFFMKAVATDWLSLSLIAAGAVLIAFRRDRQLLPFLMGALLFFVARPLNTAPWPHQMVPWLPLFAIVAGYGPAVAYDWLARARHSTVLRPVALAGLLIAMASVMDWGPRATAAQSDADERRMRSIALATDWIHGHAEPDAAVAISYYCFNSDVFFAWIRFLDVPLPPSPDQRRYLIWWGEHSALKGLQGYACATPHDVDNIKRKLDLRTPGEGSNPFADPGFERAATFGANASEVDVFRFDFSSRRRATAAHD